MFLLLATEMVLVPCVVLLVNILHYHLDLQAQDRLLVRLLGLLRLLLVHLVLVLVVIGIGIIGWEGMELIFPLLLGMIDQGHLLVLWDDIRMVEAVAVGMDVETHETEGDMEDPENMFFCFLFFAFFAYLILLAQFCLILIFIYLPVKPRQPICYLSSVFSFFAHRKVQLDMQIYVCTLLLIYLSRCFLSFLDTLVCL